MPWTKKLSRPLVLNDSTRLETLSDVRDLILDRFTTVTHNAVLAHAGALLLKAAATGNRADIEAATDQTERALRSMRLIV
jgi:hypothetical protein